MKSGWIFGCVAGMMVVSGCMTINNAYEAQNAVEKKGNGVCAEGVRKLDLSDYSLKELVQFAMTNRPSMTSAALAVVDARLALKEIAADAPLVSYSPWTSPHLALSGGYSESSTPDTPIIWQTEGNASAGLSLDILVYDFGRNASRASAQVERVLAAENDFIRAGYAVFTEVATAYFNLMESDALLSVAITNETEFALHLKEAEDRLAAGEAMKLDVTRARSNLYQAREEVIVASNNVVTSGASLMKALGIDVSHGVRDEVYPASGDGLMTMRRGFARTDYGIDSAFDLARTNAPSMAVARAQLRAASRQVDYAIADLMPSVSAQVGISWADPLWAWHWGVDAAQSVFTGFRKVTAVDRAVVAMQGAATAVDEAEQQLSLDLETAIAVRDNAVKKLETARMSVQEAREDLGLVKQQYQEGEVSRVDFTEAVTSYAKALGNRISAFYTNQRAEAALFAIVGRVPEYEEKEVKEKR